MKLRIVSLVVGLALLSLVVYFSDWERVLEETREADMSYVLAGVFSSVLLMFVRTYRWDLLLRKVGIRAPFHRAWYILMAGLFISNLTPGRIGEPVRGYILKRREKASFSKTLPSVLLERIFDTVVLMLLAVAGFALLYQTIPYKEPIALMLLVYVVFIALFFYVSSDTRRMGWFKRVLYRFFGWFGPLKKLESVLEEKIKSFHDSLKIYNDAGIILSASALSVLIWLAEGFMLYLMFLALGIESDVLLLSGILSISILIAILTSLPGGIGSQEAVMVVLITACFGYPLVETTSAVLMYRAASLWLNILVGGVCFSFKS